jgi:hypothetical protein
LITRSLRPLRQLILGVWHDWTRASFAFYGLLPIACFIAFDEVRGDEPFVAALGVILALGAVAYLRSTAAWQRVASLVAAFAVIWVAATVYLAIYWHGRKEFWMMRPGEWMQTARSMGIMGAMVLTLLVMPVVIEALRRMVNMARGQPAAG